jgi:hypothetical protein
MSLAQPPQIPISIGLAPQQAMGARMSGPISLAWFGNTMQQGLTNVISDDLIIEGEDGTISNIQSLYYDNSNCPLTVALTIGDTQQTILLAPKTQGYLPIMATNSMRYSAVAYGNSNLVGNTTFTTELSFMNVPVGATVWPVAGVASMLVSSAVNAGGALLAIATNNNGVPLSGAGLVGRDTYIHGFDITGSGATAEGPITATLTNIAGLGFSAGTETVSFVVDVPVLGGSVAFSRRFDPPLRATRLANGAPNTVTLSAPSFGAGNTAMGVVLYYTVE